MATRPREANGLGWDIERVRRELNAIRDKFPLILDSPEVFNQWIQLVEQVAIAGEVTW